jgi:hypothetical protein
VVPQRFVVPGRRRYDALQVSRIASDTEVSGVIKNQTFIALLQVYLLMYGERR